MSRLPPPISSALGAAFGAFLGVGVSSRINRCQPQETIVIINEPDVSEQRLAELKQQYQQQQDCSYRRKHWKCQQHPRIIFHHDKNNSNNQQQQQPPQIDPNLQQIVDIATKNSLFTDNDQQRILLNHPFWYHHPGFIFKKQHEQCNCHKCRRKAQKKLDKLERNLSKLNYQLEQVCEDFEPHRYRHYPHHHHHYHRHGSRHHHRRHSYDQRNSDISYDNGDKWFKYYHHGCDRGNYVNNQSELQDPTRDKNNDSHCNNSRFHRHHHFYNGDKNCPALELTDKAPAPVSAEIQEEQQNVV